MLTSTFGAANVNILQNKSLSLFVSLTDAAAEAKLRYKVNKVRVVLCPLKVRFAMILADFGLLKESIAYALEARALVQEIGVAGKHHCGFVFC